MKVINLLDATFDMDLINGMENNNFTVVSDDLASVSAWDSIDSRPWINWNLKSQAVPLTNAARALQVLSNLFLWRRTYFMILQIPLHRVISSLQVTLLKVVARNG